MLRRRTMMTSAAPAGVTLEWGSLSGSASGPLYNKIRTINVTNHTTGTLTINLSISVTRPWSSGATVTITKYEGGSSTVIANNVAVPYSTTSTITITPGQYAALRIGLVDSDIDASSWENLDFSATITGGVLSGQTVTVGSTSEWYLE